MQDKIKYSDYKGLIYHLAGKWRYSLDFDEAVAIGNYMFCYCLETYKNNFIPFSNYMSICIVRKYCKLCVKKKEKQTVLYIENKEIPYIDCMDDLLHNLSKDAIYVTELACYPTMKMRKVFTKINSRKRALKYYLRKYCRWDNKKIDKVFDEIKDNL